MSRHNCRTREIKSRRIYNGANEIDFNKWVVVVLNSESRLTKIYISCALDLRDNRKENRLLSRLVERSSKSELYIKKINK